MYRILTAFLLMTLLGTRAGAQRGERLQPKAALLRLIDANLRQAVNQYKVLMGRVPADRLPKTWYVNGDRLETSDPGW